MSIDSTAQLLFNIGANSDDAEENIARFRTLLGTDLDEMGEQFTHWANEVVGEIGTVQGAMTAGGAVIGAAMVGIGAASIEAAHKYAEYVGEVVRGSKTTGIAAEDMSALKFAATETGTSYDSLVTGLTRFASTVAKANEGGAEQQKMFARLGISQEQVKTGEKDLMPLVMATADSFQHMGSQVQRSAAARDLFSRGGAELVRLLSMGSEGIKKFAEEAHEMGLTVGSDDVLALNKYKATLNAIQAEQESLNIEIGRKTLPLMEALQLGWLGLWKSALSGQIGSLTELMVSTATNAGVAAVKVEELARSLDKVGEGKGIDDLDKQVKEAKGDFGGLSAMLENINQRMGENAGATGKATAEISHLNFEIARTTREYQKLVSEGKLTGEAMQRETAALAQLPQELAKLSTQLQDDATTKIAEIYQGFSDDIARRMASQQVKTFASQVAAWDQELAGLRDKLAKEKEISVDGKAALSTQLDQLQKDGDTKIWRDQNEAMIQAYNSLDKQTEEQSEKSYAQQVKAWNRDVDAQAAHYAEIAEFEGQYDARIEALRKAGLDRIDRDQSAAYAREMSGLQAHLGTMLNAEATRVEKLNDGYQKDLLAFSAAEEAKVLLTTKTETERAAVEQQFAQLRSALLVKYNTDLQALENSQGWQGIFGSKFGAMLKNNEALEKQWATSSDQSLLMVKVSLENLKEMGQQAFEQMAQGMGAGIANALVYSKSVGAAMEAVLKSTLESLAAQAFTQAIYSTALGFLDIAHYDYAGASAAFEAAAMFGLVGAAAGVAGRAIPSGSGASGGSGPGGSGGSSGHGSDGGAAGWTAAPSQNAGPHVVVNVQGHVFGISGVQELTSMINDAVLNRNVTLTATNTRTSQVVQQ